MRGTSFIDKLDQLNQAAWAVYNSNPLHPKLINMSPLDITRLFKALHENNVKYLLIGGFAMAFHGHVRATLDIDLWIRNDRDNMESLKKSLIELGIEEVKWMRTDTQLVAGITVFTLLDSDLTIDLMHNMKHFKEADFDNCSKNAKTGVYQDVEIPVLEARDLLQEKMAASRAKDIPDILFLARLTNYKGRTIDPGKFTDVDPDEYGPRG